MNEPQSMQDLADLASAKRQMSVRQMSLLAKKEGLSITYTTLSQILAGTYKSIPRDSTIRAIAWLAGVSDEVAFMAAGQPVPGPPFAEELPPGVDNLPAKARKAAIDMLRVLVDMNKEVVGNGDHPTHIVTEEQASVTPINARRTPPAINNDLETRLVGRTLHPGDVVQDKPSGERDRELQDDDS